MIVAAFLVLGEAVLLTQASHIPARTNVVAYEKSIDDIERRWNDNEIHSGKASRLFRAVQDRHATDKWLLTDLGYLALASGLVLALFTALFRESLVSRLTHTHSWKTTAIVALITASLLSVAGIASAGHDLSRGLAPPWEDTLAAAYEEAISLALVALFFLSATCLSVHALRRTVGATLFKISRPPFFVALTANLVFFPFASIAGCYAAMFAQWSGGWIATPAFLLMAWLFLHARGVVLATPQSTPNKRDTA